MKVKVGLFKNKFKEKEGEPDYRGSIKDGDKYIKVIAGWVNTTKSGEKYIGLEIDIDRLSDNTEEVEGTLGDRIDPNDLPF